MTTTPQPHGASHLDSGRAPEGFSAHRAYLVGINTYGGGIPPLDTPEADVRAVAERLDRLHGYDVKILTDGATLPRLRELFEQEIPREVTQPESRVLIYFAGHGIALEGKDGQPAGYLVPQGADRLDKSTYLPMIEVIDAIKKLPCRHLLLVLDCCFSGAVRWSLSRDLVSSPSEIPGQRYRRYINRAAWQALTSASADQKALDVFGERGSLESGHSPFAAALVSALEGRQEALEFMPLAQRHGVITATELFSYLYDQVENRAEKEQFHQTPGFWPFPTRHDQGEYVHLTPGHPLNVPDKPPPDEESNPYRGLKPYEEDHAPVFFGRSSDIQKLVERVADSPLVTVLGGSGAGKSSVVKAGLIPALKSSASEAWVVLKPIRPGRLPLAMLAAVEVPGETESLADRLANPRDSARGLAARIAEWGRRTVTDAQPSPRLLMVIDQFEELITHCQSEEEQKAFLDALALSVEANRERFRLVVTLRSDFEEKLPPRGLTAMPEWKAGRMVLLPITRREDYREVIEKPAAARVVFFEPPGLVDALIDDVFQTPGALPLLSFVLDELFRRMIVHEPPDRAMKFEDYRALGGVGGALQKRAEEVLGDLPEPKEAHRETLRRVMLRMVSIAEVEVARRRVDADELRAADPAEDARIGTVLQHLTAARLVVSDTDERGQPYHEPAHDRFIRGWKQLQDWIKEAREDLVVLRRLSPDAEHWNEDRTANRAILWHNDPRLPQLRAKAARDSHWFNAIETEFLNASVKQWRRGWAARIAAGVGAAVLAVVMVWFGYRNSVNSLQKRIEQAEGYLLTIGRNPTLADQAEIGVLRELVNLKDDRVRDLFIKQGLDAPASADRLFRRHEQAVHAAVGLDPRRRAAAIATATEALRRLAERRGRVDEMSSDSVLARELAPIGKACVSVGLDLGADADAESSPESAAFAPWAGEEILAQVVLNTDMSDDLTPWARLFERVAPAITGDVTPLTNAIHRSLGSGCLPRPNPPTPAQIEALSRVIKAVASRLKDPQAADHLARLTAEAILGVCDSKQGSLAPSRLERLARAWTAVSAPLHDHDPALDRQVAEALAARTASFTTSGADLGEIPALGRAIALLRHGSDVSLEKCWTAARTAIRTAAANQFAFPDSSLIAETAGTYADLEKALPGQLDPDPRRELAEFLSGKLRERLRMVRDRIEADRLLARGRALAPHLAPVGARREAQAVLGWIGSVSSPIQARRSGAFFAALAASLEPSAATDLSRAIRDRIKPTTSPAQLLAFALASRALVRLDPASGGETATSLAAAARRKLDSRDPRAIAALILAITSLERDRLAQADLDSLLDALDQGITATQGQGVEAHEELAEALQALAKPEGATAGAGNGRTRGVADHLAGSVEACLTSKTLNDEELAALARAILDIADTAGPQAAHRAASQLIARIVTTLNENPRLNQITNLTRLAAQLTATLDQPARDETAVRIAAVILDRPVMSIDPPTLSAWARGYEATVSLLPEKILIDNLRLPFCAGSFQKLALGELGRRANPEKPVTFKTLWDWVQYRGGR